MKATVLLALVALGFAYGQDQKGATATYVTAADVRALLKKAPEGSVSDQQAKIVDVGKARAGVAVVHRSGKSPQTAIEHDKVTEMYYILSGSGTMVTGGTITNAKRRAADDPAVRDLAGPAIGGSGLQNGESRKVGPGDIAIIPAGVGHWFSSVDGNIDYLVFRVDPEKVVPVK
jgi:mannose-6-phosphate isomerase-like protein (cupin superfamily)